MSRIKINERECLYSILNIDPNSSSDIIKKAYKKQALLWHPDRNIDNIEQATVKFKQINLAYQVLSDKNERAWYDSNRDKILNKTNNNNNNTFDVISYISPYAYTNFEDNKADNFYSIYKECFEKICEVEGLSIKKTPNFGDSKLSYIELKKFYNYWEYFESKRSFNYANIYNLNDAKNNRIKKLMNKENKKETHKERIKWEKLINRLVSFVKRRDPRFRNYLIELEQQKKDEERKEREYQRKIRKVMNEQRKLEREREFKQFDEILNDKPDDYIELDNETQLECIVCMKTFKSLNAFKNHKQTKKHKKEMIKVKEQLRMEEEILFNGDNNSDINGNNEDIDTMDAGANNGDTNVGNNDEINEDIDGNANGSTKTTINGDISKPETNDMNDDDIKIQERMKLDELLAQQLADQEQHMLEQDMINQAVTNNENDNNNDNSNNNNNENIADEVDLTNDDPDYLLALQLEQDEILNDLMIESDTNKGNNDVNGNNDEDTINDDEIKLLLQSGEADVNGIMDAYPNVTSDKIQEILNSIRPQKQINNVDTFKKKKKRRKKRKNVYTSNGHSKRNNDNDISDEDIDDILNKNKIKNKNDDDSKLDINSQIIGDSNIGLNVKPKKKRRRRRKKEEINSNNNSNNSNKCKGCGKVFNGNNKLHKHLKENPNHSYVKNHKY